MTNQIIVPSLGESITEATVSKWLKQVGETVEWINDGGFHDVVVTSGPYIFSLPACSGPCTI